MSDYAKGLCEKIKKEVNAEDYEHPLKGFKIVVDAGNGAGGFYADGSDRAAKRNRWALQEAQKETRRE